MSDELKPCPFCGGGETHIVDNGRVWNGTKHSDPVSVSVRHWCAKMPGQPSRGIERVGRDEQSAIKAWNMRADDTLRTQLAAMTAGRDAFSQQALDLIAKRDSAMARVATLRETLAGLEQFFIRSDEDSNENFERIGQAFYKATGMLRPGKDASMCCGYTYEEREQAFDDWCKNHLKAARNALEATR